MNESHHWGWIGVVVLAICLIAWIYSSNRPDESTYQRGSRHVEVIENNYPLSLHPCGALFKIDGENIPAKKVKK